MSEKQNTLFDLGSPDLTPRYPAAPAQRHSETSQAAAEAISDHLNSLEAKVLAYFRGKGEAGATDEDAQDEIPMGGSTERPRRIRLVELGLLRDSGRTKPGRSGRKLTIWVLAKGA